MKDVLGISKSQYETEIENQLLSNFLNNFDKEKLAYIISNYNNQNSQFSMNQMYLMILHYVSELVKSNNNKNFIKEDNNKMVFSFPSYYNENQRRLMKELLLIYGYKNNLIIPEYLSQVLCYGYENESLMNENENRKVLLIDIGYSNCNMSLFEIEKVYINII